MSPAGRGLCTTSLGMNAGLALTGSSAGGRSQCLSVSTRQTRPLAARARSGHGSMGAFMLKSRTAQESRDSMTDIDPAVDIVIATGPEQIGVKIPLSGHMTEKFRRCYPQAGSG